jgi:hypothetical protein
LSKISCHYFIECSFRRSLEGHMVAGTSSMKALPSAPDSFAIENEWSYKVLQITFTRSEYCCHY